MGDGRSSKVTGPLFWSKCTGNRLATGAVGWAPAARGPAGSEIQPYLEGGIEEAALSGGRREDGLLGGAGSRDPAYKGAL